MNKSTKENGIAYFDGFEIGWTFFTEPIAIITNSSGELVVSGPGDVVKIDVNTFLAKEESWKIDPYKVEYHPNDFVMELYHKGKKIISLEKRLTENVGDK